jgi:hypothetical protein
MIGLFPGGLPRRPGRSERRSGLAHCAERFISTLLGRAFRFKLICSKLDSILFCFCVIRTAAIYCGHLCQTLKKFERFRSTRTLRIGTIHRRSNVNTDISPPAPFSIPLVFNYLRASRKLPIALQWRTKICLPKDILSRKRGAYAISSTDRRSSSGSGENQS